MSNPLLAPQIKSKLDTSTETFAENKTAMMEKLEKIEVRLCRIGWWYAPP